MVVLSRSFTILASLSTLAAVSVLPVSVSGAPLPNPSRHAPPHANHHPNNGRNHGTNGSPSRTPDARGQSAAPAGVQSIGGLTDPLNGASSGLSSIGVPSLPLPHRSLDGLTGPLAGAVGLPSLPLPPRALKSSHEKTHIRVVEDHARASSREKSRHKDKRVAWDPLNPLLQLGSLCIGDACPTKRDGDDDTILFGRSPEPHRHHHHDDHGRIMVSGDHDRVNLHSRSPRHRYHGHDNHDKVVVTGDDDKVRVHSKRDPESTLLMDKDRTILVTSMVRRGSHHQGHNGKDELVVGGNHGYIKTNVRRDSSSAGDTPDVPGVVDVMSTDQRLASLTLSATFGSDLSSGTSAFVLNASGQNATQIYLSPIIDPSNSTAPGNATLPGNTTAPGNAPSSSNSTVIPSRRVMLKIPLFNAAEASMQSYCATFDANPAAPQPMTVETCSNGTTSDSKSQIFAYNPATGELNPMWFEGEDDGMGDSSDDTAGNGTDDSGDDGSTATPPSDSNAAKDPTGATDSTIARIANLNEALESNDFGDATKPATFAAAASHSFAGENGYSNAQNVTLKFTASVPEVVPAAYVEQVLSDALSQATATTTSSSTAISGSATTTGSSDLPSSATFGAAATSSVDPTATESAASTIITFSSVSATPTAADSTMSDATSTSSVGSGSATTMASGAAAAAAVTTSSSSATPLAIGHTLGVEVFDPEATAVASPSSSSSTNTSASTSATASTTSSVGAQAASSSSSPTADSSFSSPVMTAVSTDPYKWVFRQALAGNSDALGALFGGFL